MVPSAIPDVKLIIIRKLTTILTSCKLRCIGNVKKGTHNCFNSNLFKVLLSHIARTNS